MPVKGFKHVPCAAAEKGVLHCFPRSIVGSLRHDMNDVRQYRPCVAPFDECVLCKNGVCSQVEDVECLESPGFDRLVVHGLSLNQG